jgi:hypothetical protein
MQFEATEREHGIQPMTERRRFDRRIVRAKRKRSAHKTLICVQKHLKQNRIGTRSYTQQRIDGVPGESIGTKGEQRTDIRRQNKLRSTILVAHSAVEILDRRRRSCHDWHRFLCQTKNE